MILQRHTAINATRAIGKTSPLPTPSRAPRRLFRDGPLGWNILDLFLWHKFLAMP